MFFLGIFQSNFFDPLLIPPHIPVMIARRHLAPRLRLPTQHALLRLQHGAPWILDSGGFNEITHHGHHRTPPSTYIQEIRRFQTELPGLEWAAPQDWMCETPALRKTSKSVLEHQHLTTQNYLTLRNLAPDLPIIPVLQGQTPGDYLRHLEIYAAAPYRIDLDPDTPTIGIGSVCRRQSTREIRDVLSPLHAIDLHNLHGFGMKTQGLDYAAQFLQSADSAAWSRAARFDGHYPQCPRPVSDRRRPFLPQNCPGCAVIFYNSLHHHFPDNPPLPVPAERTHPPCPWPPPDPRTTPAATAANGFNPQRNGTPTSPALIAPTPTPTRILLTPQPAT